MLDQLTAAGLPVHAGEDAGIGRRVQNPLAPRERFQITRIADIAVANLNAQLAQRRAVQLAARPHKIVQTDDFPIGPALAQSARQRGANETANSCNQDTHEWVGLTLSSAARASRKRSPQQSAA